MAKKLSNAILTEYTDAMPVPEPLAESCTACTNPTLEQWILQWRSRKMRASSVTYAYSILRYTNHVIEWLGQETLCTLTQETIQQTINQLSAQGVSKHTLSSSFHLLRLSLEDARHRQYLDYNPCQYMRLPVVPRRIRNGLSLSELSMLLAEAEKTWLANFYPVVIFAALRIGEALGLSWRQIDFEHHAILVDQQLIEINKNGRCEGYLQKGTKYGKKRRIYPPKNVFGYLERERMWQENAKKAAGEKWQNPGDLVFTNDSTGRYISAVQVRYSFRFIRATIGLSNIHVHDLRHAGAVLNYMESHDLYRTRDYLGHRYLSTTVEYLYPTPESMQENMKKLEKFYQSLLLS